MGEDFSEGKRKMGTEQNIYLNKIRRKTFVKLTKSLTILVQVYIFMLIERCLKCTRKHESARIFIKKSNRQYLH